MSLNSRAFLKKGSVWPYFESHLSCSNNFFRRMMKWNFWSSTKNFFIVKIPCTLSNIEKIWQITWIKIAKLRNYVGIIKAIWQTSLVHETFQSTDSSQKEMFYQNNINYELNNIMIFQNFQFPLKIILTITSTWQHACIDYIHSFVWVKLLPNLIWSIYLNAQRKRFNGICISSCSVFSFFWAKNGIVGSTNLEH